MSIHIHKPFALLTTLSLATLASPTLAQSITATPDNTGTTIQHNGNTYTITGGTQAGANLFHSFTELGLAPNEIANFLSNPQTQNILGRVTGGNPSIIQGLIQVTGGNSNLLLMNPAGIVFTQGASLNVPGSFTATTADAIGFDSGIFSATGQTDYSQLTSNPNAFIFSGQNGTIVNAAQLGVNHGNLSLIGSSVINTGTLTAPNGNITITAVPDSNTIRINQKGMILGLEITPPNLESGIRATDLPRLLTAPSLQNATGVTVEPNGELRLTGSNVSIDAAGNVTLAGSVSGREVHLGAANDVNPIGNPQSLIRTHNGQYSAPTVTRFAQQDSDPNAHIFLDATVPNYSDLLFGGKPGTTTTVVVPTEDGIAKITDTLTTPGLSLVDELHIVSEGSEGDFWLGNAFVNQDNISQYQTAMQQWSQGLNIGADVLLYACLTAAGTVGEALLNNIASYSGADVAGSTNITGAGGDWILERQVGTLEATTPFNSTVLSNYRDTLAIFTATNGGDRGPGSLRQAILDAQDNQSPGDDEIRFAPGLTQVTLTSAQLDVDTTNNGGLLINGDFNGANTVIVERSAAIGTPDFRIFDITGNADVTMDALTIRNGDVAAARGNGGGINYNGTGTLTLTQSTVRDNAAKDGGGIYSQGVVNLTNSTVSGNTAVDDGGGVYTEGAVNLINTTVSGNTAVDDGGGVRSLDGGSILNSTITNNIADSSGDGNGNGGGVVRSVQGTFTIRNSIIAGNFDNSPVVGNDIHPDVSGENINGNGNNLVGDTIGTNGTLGTGSDLTFAGLNITDINQVLTPLGNYGGSTQTHALVPGSPAVDAGDNANIPGGITTDQRGAGRNFNTGVDIGAFESQGFVLQAVGTPQSTTVNTAFANPLTVQLADAFANTAIPFAGISVTFAAPNIGASGTATNPTVTTNGNGMAQTSFTANTIAGSYQVSATTLGMPAVNLNLTNTPDRPNRITVMGGNNQSTTVNQAFANPLQVLVADQFGNVVPNAAVNFTTPRTGAGGIALNATVTTNGNGMAQTSFTANTIAGNYQVNAATTGIPGVGFNLTNTRNDISNGSRDRAPSSLLRFTTSPTPPIIPSTPASPSLPDPAPTPLTATASACIEAAHYDDFKLLDLKISTIAGLMNAEGGSTSINLRDLVYDCNPYLAVHLDNEEFANAYLQGIIANRLGEEYTDLVQVHLRSSTQGRTAVIEVQPSPQPTFVQINNEEVFYLYENGNTRNLEPEAVERYQQKRWPQ